MFKRSRNHHAVETRNKHKLTAPNIRLKAPQEDKGVRESWVLYETDTNTEDKSVDPPPPPGAEEREYKIVWFNVVLYTLNHIASLYGFYLFLTTAMWKTCFWVFFIYILSGLGITAGVHRLWAHKAFKATLPLRIMLMVFNCMAFQDSVIHWARDHRMHHKYSETDADPHNAMRGFFFSHVGWLLVRKHPQIKAAAPTIDVSDLWADPVLRFQKKYYFIIMPITGFFLPAWIPTFWGESFWTAWLVNQFRYTAILNGTWLVNSAAHMWGNKPYDKNIKPVEVPILSPFVLGEGFHNYHHAFPWDYKSAELGGYTLNFTTLFLDVMAAIGLAYDLKTISDEVVKKRVLRSGDGTHPAWGWDDKDAPKEFKEVTKIVHPEKND